MKIKRVRLKNGYKRFRDLTIDLGVNPARIVALVGPNGCGKSSVLDGLMYHGNAYGMIGSGNNVPENYHSLDNRASYNYEDIEIEFVEGTFIDVRRKREAIERTNTIFSFRSPYRYNNRVKIIETKAVPDIWRNRYGASNAASIDEKMEENYRRLHAKLNRYRDTNDMRPSEAKQKIIGDLNSSIKKCLDIEIVSVGNVEAGEGTLYFAKPDHDKPFEFNVLSSGEKEVVDLLLDLYLRQEEYNDTIFLFDEPELHINTAIQGNLLVEIDRLVGQNCQIWLTTHSIGLLRALQSRMKDKCQIIRFREEDKLGSQAKTLTPMQVSSAAWRDLFSIALDDLAALVSPQKIVYCEGRHDTGRAMSERGLDARVLNNIFGAAEPDTLFISSGGNTELDQRSAVAIAILGKVLPTVAIWVLKDRDMASGKPTSETDRQIYLANNDINHRVLRRWEIENYLFDKEVLRAYCAANGTVFDEATYDSHISNIVDDDVKAKTTVIKNCCGIVGSIGGEAFKLNLSTYITPDMSVYKELRDCIFARA